MKRKDAKGKSKCPFCGGSKITPYVRYGKSQNCDSCDKEGMIKNTSLYDMELQDFIKLEL